MTLVKRHEVDERRLDYRAALICSTLANINRDRKKKALPFVPQDFMPDTKTPDQNPSVKKGKRSQNVDALIMINAAMGGKLTEKKRGQ